MTSGQSPITRRIRIDTAFLLRQASALRQVKQKRRTCDEFGEAVLRDFLKASPTTGSVRDQGEVAASPEAVCWSTAKDLVHGVLATTDPQYDAIRKRLGNLQEPSTPRLLATLSLWLAGMLGISVSGTGPLVAVMLYAAAEADGDWEVLRDPKKN